MADLTTPSDTALAPITAAPQTLRDMVQARMREAIVSGHFAPGERLVERPLCEQLGVSRTVVRETIRYLEAEGLVEIQPGRGPRVARLDRDQAAQIHAIRAQLESAAAAACARGQGQGFGARLSGALRQVAAGMNDTDWTNLLEATTAFYALIFQEAGHTIAWEIVQRLNGRISRLRALTITARDRDRSGLAHMQAIHDAILARDPGAASAAVRAHLHEAASLAQRILEDAEQQGK